MLSGSFAPALVYIYRIYSMQHIWNSKNARDFLGTAVKLNCLLRIKIRLHLNGFDILLSYCPRLTLCTSHRHTYLQVYVHIHTHNSTCVCSTSALVFFCLSLNMHLIACCVVPRTDPKQRIRHEKINLCICIN